MIKRKIIKRVIAAVLVLTITCSIMLTAAVAAATNDASFAEAWQPPKNFVDPVTLKIQEFKLQRLSDEQITAKLAEMGMGWYPKTGATWMGRALSKEELAEVPDRTQGIVSAATQGSALLQVGRMSIMRTSRLRGLVLLQRLFQVP